MAQIDSEAEMQKSFNQLQEKLMAHGISLSCQLFDGQMSRETITSTPSQEVPSAATNEGSTGHEGLEVQQLCLAGELVELVKEYRCIWDTSCRSFKETPKKQQAWRVISSTLKRDGMFMSIRFQPAMCQWAVLKFFKFLHSS